MKIKLSTSWIFLISTIVVYFLTLLLNKSLFYSSIIFFWQILLKVVPIFILVFILMIFTNRFVTPKFILKHVKQKGMKKWVFAIIGGILSTGPVYMWYPLLADLKNKGLNNGLIACFLYNRAIKVPLLPLIILYFNWKFVVILTIVMIFASIVQGLIIDKAMEVKK
jgi:uncharacterized membrane protein YraQ (UPF0718 family)